MKAFIGQTHRSVSSRRQRFSTELAPSGVALAAEPSMHEIFYDFTKEAITSPLASLTPSGKCGALLLRHNSGLRRQAIVLFFQCLARSS
jgi:hypothetical protein